MEKSVGILVYRYKDGQLEVFLAKCGGPKWKNVSIGVWNIPKGHKNDNESDIDCAFREFNEETSLNLSFNSLTQLIDLGETTTVTGKIVRIFALEHDFAPDSYFVKIKSNICETEWPPKSGKIIKVPELEDAYYFKIAVAKRMIFPYQKYFLNKLIEKLKE